MALTADVGSIGWFERRQLQNGADAAADGLGRSLREGPASLRRHDRVALRDVAGRMRNDSVDSQQSRLDRSAGRRRARDAGCPLRCRSTPRSLTCGVPASPVVAVRPQLLYVQTSTPTRCTGGTSSVVASISSATRTTRRRGWTAAPTPRFRRAPGPRMALTCRSATGRTRPVIRTGTASRPAWYRTGLGLIPLRVRRRRASLADCGQPEHRAAGVVQGQPRSGLRHVQPRRTQHLVGSRGSPDRKATARP